MGELNIVLLNHISSPLDICENVSGHFYRNKIPSNACICIYKNFSTLSIIKINHSICSLLSSNISLPDGRWKYYFMKLWQLLSKQTSMKGSIELKIHSHLEELCKKGVVENFTKLTGKHLCQGLFLLKLSA